MTNATQTETKAAGTIRINGRDFAVETTEGKEGTRYIFTGKRGAKYGTMRNIHRADRMFIITLRGFGIAAGFEGVWLTDSDGSLKVVA